MSSIPLVATQIKPPEQPNLVNNLTTLLGVRNQLQQYQMQQQQMVGEQQRNEMQALQLQDQKVLRTAAQGIDWKQPDAFDKFLAGAQQAGVSPQTLSGMSLQRQQFLEQVAKTDSATLANDKTRNDRLLGHIDAIRGVTDPAQRAQVAQTQANQVLSAGLVKDPQMAQMVQAIAQGKTVPSNEDLDLLAGGLEDHNTQIENKLKTQQTATSAAQQKEAETNTAVKAQELKWGGNPQMQESRYRFVLSRLAAKQPVSPEDMAAATAYEASQAKSTSTSDSLGVMSTNTSRPTGLAQFRKGPAGAGGAGAKQNAENSIVDMIGNYQADPTLLSRMFFKHPEILGLIRQKYPDFDQTTYNAKNKLITGYTSGTQSKEINAINTAMGHVSVLDQAVEALNNGNITLLNKIGNQLGINVTGQTAAAAFKTIVHRVGPEITSAYIPGAGGEAERIANAADFSENLPPQTLHNNAAVTVRLLRSKVGSLENQYKNTVGRDDFTQRFITPEAQASFQRFGGRQAQQPTSSGVHINPQTGEKIRWDGNAWVKVP